MIAYFVEDLIQQQWKKLKLQYKTVKDFEHLKRLLDNYIVSLQKGLFLHVPKIIELIFDIINLANHFLKVIKSYE